MKQWVNKLFDKFGCHVQRQLFENAVLKRFIDMSMEGHWHTKAQNSVNPLLRHGDKFYSQNDEDGIINTILKRLKIERGFLLNTAAATDLKIIPFSF